MNLNAIPRLFGIAALAATVSLSAVAADKVVAEGVDGIRVTVDDLNADIQRVPPGQRAQVLSQPDAVQQVTQNLYLRRVLAAEAVQEGLDKDPLVASTLQLLRDRVLSDAKLAKVDEANKPTEAAIEAGAQAAYKANPEKFRTPNQTRVRHILLQGTDTKVRDEARKLLADIKAGADFEKVAMEKSQDGSAQRGGDLGWFEPGKMVPEFEAAVDELKNPGDISDVVRSQFGWHIIKLEGRRPGGQRTYEEMREELRAQTRNRLQSDARLKEAMRISSQFKPDRAAIEAFSATHKQ